MVRPDVLVPVKIYVSTVFPVPVEVLWPYFGVFDSLAANGPDFSCEIEDGAHPKQIGAVRVCRVKGVEGTLREYLVALNEALPFPSITYSFHPTRPGEKSIIALSRYDAINRYALRPVTLSTPTSTLIEATSDFLAEPSDAAELKKQIEGYFEHVFEGLKSRLK